MKKKLLVVCLFTIANYVIKAQNVGINNSDPKAALDLNGGFRLRSENTMVTGTNVMLTSNRSHHVLTGSPVADFNIAFTGATENGQHAIITNTTFRKGFLVPIYIQPNTTVELIYSNGAWKLIGSNEPTSTTAWGLSGNVGLDTNKFIGTTDNNMLLFKINNVNSGQLGYSNNYNTSFGVRSLPKLTNPTYAYFENTAIGGFSMGESIYGYDNTALGYRSLNLNNSVGNTAIGAYALLNSKNGQENTALGFYTLESNNGYNNVALGTRAMVFDSSGNENIAIGAQTMYNSKNSNKNVAAGTRAMLNLINGNGNVAIGYEALYSDSSANGIVAIGRNTLYYNNGHPGNVAIGDSAMYNNAKGGVPLNLNKANHNTAIGAQSLFNNIAGNQNVAVGGNSLYNNKNGNGAVAIGSSAIFTDTAANGIVAIGRAALYKNYNNPGNLAIGDSALFNNSSKDLGIRPTWSINNVAIGNKAMYRNATGSSNTAIGVNAMTTNYNGNDNTAIGFESFKNATASSSNNIAIGSRAMSEAIEVTSNIAIGTHTLNRTSRSGNIAIGDSSLANYVGFVFDGNISGNVAIGYQALKSVTIGNHNTGIGSNAGEKNFNGIGNVYVGYQAGFNNSQGGGNVFLGNQAGYNAYGANKLYIENTTTDSLNSLIYGDFAADSLLLNAKTVVRNNAVLKGYTRLGGYGADVPSIKMKKISSPAGPAVNAVQSYPLGSGITDAKVVGIQVLMNYAGSWKIPPSYIDAAGYEYNVQVQNNNIVVVLKSGNSANIGGKPISVIVTYEE